ncbi:glycosyltransferase family 4 protein [Curvivirga aplysinae]|uniref:glycosyltransferase family 4 protein n=1 Tax=Curvivirga aplysinae TaxID=2529852 RepID=UPI0012BC0CCA|nr:glycosyltransferase family 4 protein [Curvivirga aplysinae]MTI11406.1 glycosyltransferase family 4 protein [Curvivirga aplysinae]
MKIAFLISTLSPGGAEKVAVTLCNQWVKLGHDVTIFTFESPGTPHAYDISTNVKLVQLDLLKESKSKLDFILLNVKRLIKIRAQLRAYNPDISLSFMTEVNIQHMLSTIGLPWPKLISERIHPAYHRLRSIDNFLRQKTYGFADMLAVQSGSIKTWCKNNLRIDAEILPNPIDLAPFKKPVNHVQNEINCKKIVTVGRLNPQKGLDSLIEVFAQLSSTHPDWHLEIYGQGSEKERLERQIQTFNLTSNIKLCGITNDVPAVLWQSDIYVHSARYEGFPNAIIEALAAGCAVVSTDGPTAADELLGKNKFGLLAKNGDLQDLAKQLDKLMTNEQLRLDFKERAAKAVTHLSVEKVANQWLTHMNKLINKKSGK